MPQADNIIWLVCSKAENSVQLFIPANGKALPDNHRQGHGEYKMKKRGFWKQKDGIFRPHPNCNCLWINILIDESLKYAMQERKKNSVRKHWHPLSDWPSRLSANGNAGWWYTPHCPMHRKPHSCLWWSQQRKCCFHPFTDAPEVWFHHCRNMWQRKLYPQNRWCLYRWKCLPYYE